MEQMDLPLVRAVYCPDEELPKLRAPRTRPFSTLSINAAEFVPRFHKVNAQQDMAQKQKQFLQNNYPQYAQHQYQHQYQEEEQYPEQQQTYYNAYDQYQQQQQHYQQPSQNLNAHMGSMSISSSVQDRLRNNSANRVGSFNQQQHQHQQQQQHHQQQYHNQNHHRFNKNHHQQQQQQQQHDNNPNQHCYDNHHNKQQQQQTYQQQQDHQQQQCNASAVAESTREMENIALDYLLTVIQCLNQNPGQFDSIATRFITIFDGMENNFFVLSIAMDDIFDESIKNPNFRYMGAKLYNLLHMLNPSKDSLFHTLLKYKLEHHQQEVLEYMQNKQEAKVRETALFLAELYMQLRGDDSRIYLIADSIAFSLKELLSMEDNKDNIRCVCLTLKLAGYDLTNDCRADMSKIIGKLETINCQNPGKYPLANNVISLQKNNWGRKPCNPQSMGNTATATFVQPLRQSDDPVFYGPDGREITAEECEFLTNGAGVTSGSSENEEENDDLDLDPEMDEETERDFKLFLKHSNNKT